MRKLKGGGKISINGYENDSPDKFNNYNIIPSNQITMQNVSHPVFGIDNLGNQQMMYPGQDYTFPGNYVTEYPMKKKSLKKAQLGLETDPFSTRKPWELDNNSYRPNGFTQDTMNPTQQPIQPSGKSLTIKDYLSASKNALPRMGSNLMNEFVDPTSLYNVLGNVEAGVNFFDNRARNNQQEDWLASQRNTDNLFFTQPGGDRGDYVVNGSSYGQFRPDEMGSKSPYGTTGMYYPSMQMGGTYTTPVGNVITPEDLAMFAKNTGIKWDSAQQYGEYLDQFAKPLPPVTKSKVTYPFGKRGETMTQDEWDYSRKKRKYPDVYSDKVQGKDNFIPGEIYSNEIRNDIAEYRKLYPKMEYGGQNGFALELNNNRRSMTSYKDQNPISKTLQPVNEDEANIEAELGETIFGDFDNDGINEHMKVGGKRHSQGGTPLEVPPASFVFSDTKSLKIGGEILEAFGKKADTKKKFTPADLAKQYDINKYKAILDDKDADPIKLRTAEMMIENYNNKLGQLALVQEDKKGFPNGIPQVAIPYLMGQMIPAGLEGTSTPNNEQMFATGGQYDPWENIDPATGLPIDPYKGGKTKAGTTTPTGKQNPYDRKPDHLTAWESIIPGIRGMKNAEAQSAMYNYNLTNNPESIKNMWSTYGLTAKGLRDKNVASLANNGVFDPANLTQDNLAKLESAYADGYFGVRQMDPAQRNVPQLPNIPTRTINPTPPTIGFNPPAIPQGSLEPNTFVPRTGQDEYTNFWTQDKINAAYALQNKANINKYLPWAAPITGVGVDPTFYDPTRELAANAENMNTEMMYNAQFSGPQSLGARNSAVSGNSASNVANILGRYNNQNVGVANQFEGINAEIMNQLSAQQGARANNLYQGNVIANQQYDNSIAQANDVVRKNIVGALNNKQTAGWMNSWYPQFNLDPSSGRVSFTEGSGRSSITSGGSAPKSYIDVYKELKLQNPNVPDEVLREQAKQMTGQARNTITSDGDIKSTYQGPTPQMLMQMLKGQI